MSTPASCVAQTFRETPEDNERANGRLGYVTAALLRRAADFIESADVSVIALTSDVYIGEGEALTVIYDGPPLVVAPSGGAA